MTLANGRASTLPEMQQLLGLEREELSRFVKLLEDEQGALIACQVPRIAVLAAEKAALAARLQSLEFARTQCLVAAGLRGTSNGMHAWLTARAKSDPSTLICWKYIESYATRAKTLNELNGKLIAIQLTHHKSQFDALTRNAFPQQIYDAGGHTRRATYSRSLAAA
jgi:flagellar biosynthesis protein FlgN